MSRRGRRADALPVALTLALTLAMVAAALAVVAACGGGGGGGGGGGPTMPQPSLTFVPDTGTATPSITLSARADSTADTLFLELRASQVTDLYGVSFDLQLPSTLLHFTAATEGNLLATNGAPTSFQVAESPPGNLVIGASRLGDIRGVDGSGLLATFELAATGTAGSGAITFSRNNAFDHTVQNQTAVVWRAGTVQVIR